MSKNKVAIVVPVHNAPEYVQALLNRLELYNLYVPKLLVDDASGPETHALLARTVAAWQQRGLPAELRVNGRQQLFTRTVNRGLRAAVTLWDPERIAVVNTDCDLQSGWLAALTQIMEADPTVGLAGYPDAPTGGRPQVQRIPAYVTGHCFLLRVSMLQQIGLLTETDLDGRDSPELRHLKGQAHIGSDRLLSWRANTAGWKTVYCQEKLVGHPGGRSWGHNLQWLASFDLQPLWEACDTLAEPVWLP